MKEIMQEWTMVEFYNQLQYLADVSKTQKHDAEIAKMNARRS